MSRPVLNAVLALPRFPELSIGENAVIAALAWLPDHAVDGLAAFRHLGYEPTPDSTMTTRPAAIPNSWVTRAPTRPCCMASTTWRCGRA
ncbi:hypothetical protein [Salinarimonas soli]|uniref:Uncharacterized protein n=1 Tax=Salinarimonas soli TaxID=1638099 RepID=A0A5B2VBK7_9HYPH|nr:hypothetical protein [Salinarimonas soli]KAA2236156.1 hypothetical protein F0L46_15700 [Salinarimonas soli]